MPAMPPIIAGHHPRVPSCAGHAARHRRPPCGAIIAAARPSPAIAAIMPAPPAAASAAAAGGVARARIGTVVLARPLLVRPLLGGPVPVDEHPGQGDVVDAVEPELGVVQRRGGSS